MKVNELRIGNYFYPIDKSQEVHIPIETPFKVLSIGFEVEAIPYDKVPAEIEKWKKFKWFDLSPIPITEEWLLKFGFKKAYNEWILHPCFEVKIIIYNEGVYNGVMFYTRTIHADYAPIYCNNHINYVHQLQNLYHALTGEELKNDTTN